MTQVQDSDLDKLVVKEPKKIVDDTGKTLDSVVSHLVDQADRLARLEVQMPQLGKDLQKQLSDMESNLRDAFTSSREEQHKLANDRMQSIEEKLDKLEKMVNDALTGDEDKEPRTKVDLIHKAEEHQGKLPPQLPEGMPHQIVPPSEKDEPRGIRGRRHARRGAAGRNAEQESKVK